VIRFFFFFFSNNCDALKVIVHYELCIRRVPLYYSQLISAANNMYSQIRSAFPLRIHLIHILRPTNGNCLRLLVLRTVHHPSALFHYIRTSGHRGIKLAAFDVDPARWMCNSFANVSSDTEGLTRVHEVAARGSARKLLKKERGIGAEG